VGCDADYVPAGGGGEVGEQSGRQQGDGRVYLDVPYAEKEAAKQAGARWDQPAKRWYAPHGLTPALQRWAARPEVPEVLPGEDRTFGDGLFVDLVPRSCWFTNVRSCVSQQDWERLRRPIVRRAGHRCEVCGAGEDRVTRRWLDVHERWSYEDLTGVQALRRLIALCEPCHLVTHFGRANLTGRTEEAFAHLRAVTSMSEAAARAHVQAAQQVWIERSSRVWELDLSMLVDAGVELRRPATATDRAAAVDGELSRVGLPEPRTSTEARRADPAPARRPDPIAGPPREQAGPRPSPAPTPSDVGRALATADWHGGPDDLARNAPGIGVTHEAARRRQTEGEGADRSWRVGADGEATVAEVLAVLTTPSRLDRLRRRAPAWHVLHAVPIGTGRGDVDHVLIGPPGVVTINTKHHRAGRLALAGEELTVNGRKTDYVPKARREAERAGALLCDGLIAAGRDDLAGRLQVHSMIVVVGGRVLIESWAPGVTVVMTRQLVHALTSMPPTLDHAQAEAVYSVARFRPMWKR
jgi:Domain of unknown function (DUF5710)/Nuclease-related domain